MSSINLLGKNWWCHISFVSAYHVNLLCHSLCIKVKSYVLLTLYRYFRMLEIMILTRMSLRQSHSLRRCFVPNCGIWRLHCFVANGHQYFYAYMHTVIYIYIYILQSVSQVVWKSVQTDNKRNIKASHYRPYVTLLALYEENHSVTGLFPSQRCQKCRKRFYAMARHAHNMYIFHEIYYRP